MRVVERLLYSNDGLIYASPDHHKRRLITPGDASVNATIGAPPIETASEFHGQIATALSFPPYYGKHLNALWDVLRLDIERPTTVRWKNSSMSSRAMKGEFDEIVALFREAA